MPDYTFYRDTYEGAQIMKEICEMILKKIPKEDLDIVINYVNDL